MRKITKLIIRTLYALLKNGGQNRPVKLSTILKYVQKKSPQVKKAEVVKALKTGNNLGLFYLSPKGDSVVPAEIFQSLSCSNKGRFIMSACWRPILWRQNKKAYCKGCGLSSCKCCSCCSCHLHCPFCPGASEKRDEIMRTDNSWFSKIKRVLGKYTK
ncbi:uncharacterized protein LOC106670413 [Cimex lectularius]|uniref:Uncharacterized protein n=1 Tax=Cimex lectularius TaxID=79782 RepID=A0A8I6S4W0_CIMLE|nr:uncharacterized protein LOC106670413 [Cimex lectularius]